MSKNTLGLQGEIFAVNYIKGLGYRVIDTNYSTKYGELDIVAIKNETLIFLEVKTRRSRRYGTPYESVTKDKLNKIKLSAQYFMQRNKDLPKKMKIEVISIVVIGNRVESIDIVDTN